MPFQLPFNNPFFYKRSPFYKNFNYPPNPNISCNLLHNNTNHYTEYENKKYSEIHNVSDYRKKRDSELDESSESFFEIFGLKLYIDDILIICLLFFLYTEKVQDTELFVCLILLLLS